MNSAAEESPFDVLIMGAGFAGICQARHLLMKCPGLKVGLIDPKGPREEERDLKVGESLVEISAMFLYKELDLHEYLIENHPPKFGLNFHWPKDHKKTEKLDDYFHVWTNGNPDLPSFQLNRAKFEADVLAMCIEMGAEFIQGKVVDVELNPGKELNVAKVKTRDGEYTYSAHHLIDAAGRKFIINRKKNNLLTDSVELTGIDTGSAWMRVDNVDRTIFQKERDSLNGSASHYYGTNHWFGHGHWIWQIPIETESRAISFGVVHHKNVIESSKINSKEKFIAFLKANHKIVYDMVQSGEVIDFKYLPQIAHACEEMISGDQWYIIGEAANMYDPFYSTGLVVAAHNIECVTEIIRGKIADEPGAEEKREAYDDFMLRLSRAYAVIYRHHDRHLGDATVMSWRTYMESTFWFGILVPAYTGKWFLERDFIANYLKLSKHFFVSKDSYLQVFYEELNRVQDKGSRIGMMNYTRTNQLAFGFNPLKFWDDFRQNSKYERRHLNVLAGIKNSIFYLAIIYGKLRILNSGFFGLFAPRTVKLLTTLFGWWIYTSMGEAAFRFKMRKTPCNTKIAMQDKEALEEYMYDPSLVSWEVEKSGDKKEMAQENEEDRSPELTPA